MKRLAYLLMLLIFSLLLAACSGRESDVVGAPQGPALIMFYTDN